MKVFLLTNIYAHRSIHKTKESAEKRRSKEVAEGKLNGRWGSAECCYNITEMEVEDCTEND